MKHYRKMIAAVIGVAIIQINHHYGLDLSAAAPAMIDGLLSLGVIIGVWGVPND